MAKGVDHAPSQPVQQVLDKVDMVGRIDLTPNEFQLWALCEELAQCCRRLDAHIRTLESRMDRRKG